MSMLTIPIAAPGPQIAAGTIIHRGLLSLIGSPPEMVQRFDATYRHGYGALTVDLHVGRTPITLVGVQSVRCAADLAGRMGNKEWSGLSDDDVFHAALSEIQFRRGAMERGILRHLTPLDRSAFHLAIAAFEQTLTVISLADAGLLELLPDALIALMVVYSCAAIARDCGRNDTAFAEQARQAAHASIRAWRQAWSSASLEDAIAQGIAPSPAAHGKQ